MDEKIIIKSKVANVKLIRNILWIVGLLGGIIASALYAKSAYTPSIKVMFSQTGILCFLAVAAPLFIIGFIFYKATSKISLTVTDKRVYGKAMFGKRVDLPFDMISAVGTSAFKGIAVATSSGAIKFIMMENRDSIHDAISEQLVLRQTQKNRKSENVIRQEIPQSNADELKKYKDLLDSGVITQEEFDAKKKQLLGL